MSEKIVLKCVLLGESGVGKSSLINRFIRGNFNKDSLPTIVGGFSTKEIFYEEENTKIVYEIWDTAGQEKYRSINKIFYQDAYINILVYDITKKNTFKAIKDYWIEEIKENGPRDAIIIIAGNKSDLYDNEAVPEKEAREFAKSINAVFALTSAQNNTGVTKLFEDIGNKYLDPNFQEKVSDAQKQHSESIAINREQHNEQTKEKKKKKGFC